jgi:hypothetical protein
MSPAGGKAFERLNDHEEAAADASADSGNDDYGAPPGWHVPDERAFLQKLTHLDAKLTRAALAGRGVNLTPSDVAVLTHLQIHRIVSECRNHHLRKLTETSD